MECAQVTEEQRLWTETQIQKAKHNAWPSCLASVYLTTPPVAESRLKPLLKQLSPLPPPPLALSGPCDRRQASARVCGPDDAPLAGKQEVQEESMDLHMHAAVASRGGPPVA